MVRERYRTLAPIKNMEGRVAEQLHEQIWWHLSTTVPLLVIRDVDFYEEAWTSAQALARLLCDPDIDLARRTAFRVYDVFRGQQGGVQPAWWRSPCGILACWYGWNDTPSKTVISPSEAAEMLGLGSPDSVSTYVNRGYVASGPDGFYVDKASVLLRIAQQTGFKQKPHKNRHPPKPPKPPKVPKPPRVVPVRIAPGELADTYHMRTDTSSYKARAEYWRTEKERIANERASARDPAVSNPPE